MASVKSLRPKVETQHQKIRAFLAGAAMPTEKKKTAIETLMSLQRPRRVPYSYNIYTRDICLKKSNNTHNGRCICALKAMKRKHPTLRVKKYMWARLRYGDITSKSRKPIKTNPQRATPFSLSCRRMVGNGLKRKWDSSSTKKKIKKKEEENQLIKKKTRDLPRITQYPLVSPASI